MANEAGVVKSVTGGSVRAINDATGEVRNLSVGDIVYQNEKIVTDSADSKVTITQTDGKEITLIGKDTITLDQDTNNNQTVADISALQQAILNGTDLNALEETAAGGPQAGNAGGDGVSLGAASFAEGGHISNIYANVASIDALALAGAVDNALGVSGGSAGGDVAGATGPALPTGSIKIPLSAYKGESVSSALLDSFASSIPNGYHVYRHTDGRDYLTPNDPTAPSAFEYKEGWYVSNDGNLAIGQDNAKDLAVTSTAKASNYPDDGSVAKIVDPSQNLKVFGSDTPNNITVDNAKITSVHAGVGEDNIDAKNGAKLLGISGGSGSDDITVESGSFVNQLYGDNKTQNDIYEKRVHPDLDIEDKGAAADTIKVTGNGTKVNTIGAGDGDDNITVDKGAQVKRIVADEGNDKITVSDSGTYVSAINGRGGDDIILVEKGAKVDGIVGRWGNDNITITGAGTVVTKNVEGNEDGDTIKILDGARVKGYVSGGRGESPSIYGGAPDSDKDNITIEKAIVEGNVEGGDKSGNDGIKIANSQIGGKVYGGYGENTIEITEGTNNNVRWAQGNKFNDEITVKGNAKLNGTYLLGEVGSDTITIKDNAQIKGGNIDTGAGANDKININGNAEIDGTALQLGAGSFIGGKSTDKATLDVTENAVLKDVTVQASQSSGEQLMNFHQNGEAKVHTITGSNNKDVIDITGNFTVSNKITGNGGNDEINIHGGATAKIQQADMGDGNDKLTIDNATLKDSLVNMNGGNDEININAGANLTDTTIYTDGGNDTVNVRGGTFSKTEIGLGKGKNEVNIESGAVFGDQDAGLNGFGHHKTYIRSGHSDSSEDTINVKAGATVQNAEIKTYGGKDTLKVDGSITNSNVDLGLGDYSVNINSGAIIDNVSIKTGGGVGTVNINAGATVKKVDVTTGAENDIVNIGSDITAPATTSSATQSNIITGAGSDTVNIASGVTLTRTVIDMGAGEDTIELKGNSDTDRITFKGSDLYTDDAGYTANDIDHVTITNTTFMKSDDGRLSSVRTGGGNDEVTVQKGTIFQDFSYIATGNGVDTITLESGAKFNQANVYADAGDDIIKVNGAEFQGPSAGIHGGDGNDEIFVNSGKFDNASIEGDAGNDLISIKQGVNLNNTTIDGGAGDDTLKIADDSLDFSKVKNIEKLDLTEGSHNINLSAKDVLDMTDDRNKLRIGGDSDDHLGLKSKGWVASGAKITDDGIDYNVYTNTEGGKTVTLEVQDHVHVF